MDTHTFYQVIKWVKTTMQGVSIENMKAEEIVSIANAFRVRPLELVSEGFGKNTVTVGDYKLLSKKNYVRRSRNN